MDDQNIIAASEVAIEVTDAATGKIYKRVLPIDYFETSTVLRLRGEDLEGRPSELVFFSEHGQERLADMTGKGPDSGRCGGH